MSARILALLEKDESSQEVAASLADVGHIVQVVSSFADAIQILQAKEHIDLVISDVHLENGGNVFDFLRWVQERPSQLGDVAFVLFSCRPTPMAKHLEEGLRIASRMLGAAQYISMERFDGTKLREQIKLLLPPSVV
ncbi:MAG: response regulator [Cyanobacteria bacterium SZAS TMP-1]|nr:response regulator [Cyanobacteria bacterium SZAS TMP-1]